MKRTLIVMVKEPRPGRVKTRLGRGIGLVPAAWWFRHQSRRLLRRMRDPRWRVVLAVSPDVEGRMSRVWPADLPRTPQGRGDLGDRMARLFRRFRRGDTCIIGADIPGIGRSQVARAFAGLGASDAVFGPAPDGGYWLIGVKATAPIPPGLFNGVRWSSAHALSDTIATLPGLRVRLVDELQDVDSARDLRMTAPGARAT
ncbi:TIGR04282 family arsenosugar biosynthesis glycosyltransferase [Roseobacter sinensis]|uniref:TIGR04282 family arsenosugar biosynthesis glycosyltransferase n=1 Tax=Roseobacter sinensis TaxID=2931391 RepID=A0ABT3B8M2_9RHOB|nr:TIGR04282 family arsenosugar biosynthesis glycosyltransferase [Roseobacter sp. WL0113]MCV3269921.1 TIGR04282 family arsenosugar biosynthesis glycosyltransferase [Roseobacter sp. WL0113]